MRFWSYHTITALTLLVIAWSVPADAYVGLRACGAADLGTLYDTDCIAIDRIGTETAVRTSPQGIADYLLRTNQVAPYSHDHPVATDTAAGFMSATDRLFLSGFSVRSRDEGAVADGAWHSLASQGYTVAAAQAQWPYLTTTGATTGTHLIQTTADLSSYGVDWCALQDAINRAAAQGRRAVVSAMLAAHMVERSLTTPGDATIDISGDGPAARWKERGSSIRPYEGVFPAGAPLIETAAGWSGKIINIRLAATTEGVYRGIRIQPGYEPREIYGLSIEGMLRGIEIIPAAYQVAIHHVRTWQCTIGVYLAAGVAGNAHERPWIYSNEFDRGYHSLADYAIRTADGVAVTQPVIERNQSAYHLGLYYHYDTTSGITGVSGEISHNRIIAYQLQPSIVTVGAYEWEFRICDNQCWEGQGGEPRIVVAGVSHLTVTGNTASHSSGYLLQIKSVPYSLVLSGNTNGNGASTAHGQLYMPQAEMISSGAAFPAPGAMKLHLGPGHATAAGQIIPTEANVAYIDLVSYTPRTVVDVVSPAQPGLDADTIIQRTAGNLVLWYSYTTMTGKRYRIINKGTATINVTCPGGGLQDAAGNTVSSLPVAVHGSISVIHLFGAWRQE